MIEVQVRASLAHLSDDALDAITAGAGVFFDRRWFRMIESLDLSALVGGAVELRYAIAWSGFTPVAVCPFLVTRSPSVHIFYSLEKFFFTPWWSSGVEKHSPSKAGQARWARHLVNVCGFLARGARAGVGGWVLAVSPLSHRADIVLAPMKDDEARAVRDRIVETLQEVASDEDLPLCFLGLQEDKRDLRASLEQRGFEEVFVGFDNLLELPCRDFAGYLARFKSEARRLFNREIREARSAGVTFTTTTTLGDHGTDFDRLYEATATRYSDDHFAQPPSFWSAMERHLAGMAEAVVGVDAAGPAGFALLLHKNDEVWFHRVGRSYEGAAADALVYFNLAFYEPVKRALELRAKRLWLGFGTWEAKRRRGANAHAIHSAFWFPRPWSRALLMPYLRVFGHLSRNAMPAVQRPCSYLKEAFDASRKDGA